MLTATLVWLLVFVLVCIVVLFIVRAMKLGEAERIVLAILGLIALIVLLGHFIPFGRLP